MLAEMANDRGTSSAGERVFAGTYRCLGVSTFTERVGSSSHELVPPVGQRKAVERPVCLSFFVFCS